jgi:acyl-CoA thioester hydrolase
MRAIFTHRIEVRFRDCDPLGHANNAVYLTYLEQARLMQWRTLWRFGGLHNPVEGQTQSVSEPARDVPGVILARVEIDYKRPAIYGELLDVRIGLAGVGRTSFTYEYEIVNAAGHVVATARTVQVFYDYREKRPAPIPDELRHVFDSL